jgi:hypothetical protein
MEITLNGMTISFTGSITISETTGVSNKTKKSGSYVSSKMTPQFSKPYGYVIEQVRNLRYGETKVIQSHTRSAIYDASKRCEKMVKIAKQSDCKWLVTQIG